MGLARLRTPRVAAHCRNSTCSRLFGASPAWNSGHNRWSKIKHDKGKADALKSKDRSALSKELYIASKCRFRHSSPNLWSIVNLPVGGSNPLFNPRLAAAITNAKRGALSKPSIEASIARGQGLSADGASLEPVVVEAMLPQGVAVVMECLTESKNRLLNDLRGTLNKSGCTMTATAFMFDRIGRVSFCPHPTVEADHVLDDAIDAGAQDVETDDNKIVVISEPENIKAVADALVSKYTLKVEQLEVLLQAKEDHQVSIDEQQLAGITPVMAVLEEEPSLQALYTNIVEHE